MFSTLKKCQIRVHRTPSRTDPTGPGRIPILQRPRKATLLSLCHTVPAAAPRLGSFGDRRVSGRRRGGGKGPQGQWDWGPSWQFSLAPFTRSASCTRAPFVACSHATLAFSLRANQGISRNDYNQPRWPESCPRALPGLKTHCSSILWMSKPVCFL